MQGVRLNGMKRERREGDGDGACGERDHGRHVCGVPDSGYAAVGKRCQPTALPVAVTVPYDVLLREEP